MSSDQRQAKAVEVLQELGLKEYEAKSFVALSRLPKATAKGISEHTDVPRTRVYDAIRVLEAKGLVEIQHSNPRQFRAVPMGEAVDSLEELYESRVDTLRAALKGLEPAERSDEEVSQEVWGLSGSEAIASRTNTLIGEATEEVVMVIGSDELLTDELLAALEAASTEGDVLIGTDSEPAQALIREEVPGARVFVSGLEWLHAHDQQEETDIGRLLLVDRETILLSSVEDGNAHELGIFGRGFGNGLVVIARRIMATGLIPEEDPGQA